MDDRNMLAERFETNRDRLRAVAYRMLGSAAEAEDAVQEAWLRLHRADTGEIANMDGWLTTVVGRICLDMLRTRQSRREEALDAAPLDSPAGIDRPTGANPEQQALLGDAVGAALLVVLDTLSPAERLAFVLHDMFGVPFEEVGPIVDRSPGAARQLASRARRRVRGTADVSGAEIDRRREVVTAFLAAAREGDFASLIAVLDPNAEVRPDAAAMAIGGEWEARGATAVAKAFSGNAKAARPALIDGVPGAVWAPGGQPRVAVLFTFAGDTIAAIDLVADPERLAGFDLEILSR